MDAPVKLVTHILNGGITTLCGRILNDEHWPADHNWVAPGEHNETATCAKCRSEAGLEVTPENFLNQIDLIYAFLSMDESGEGIIGAPIGPGGSMMPLIASDATRMRTIVPLVHDIANAYGMKIKLVKFTTREMIEEINPTER